MTTLPTDRVWYVAYASNLAPARFRHYLHGGLVPGGVRDYAGCRDPSDPTALVSLSMTGGLVFAGQSRVWGGGMAFYAPLASGEVACRGYLITAAQLADVVAQEVRRPPGGPFAEHLERSLPASGSLTLAGPGPYDVLAHVGDRDGFAQFTITHAHIDDLEPTSPSAPYLRWVARGLRDAHHWDDHVIGTYLAAVPGAAGAWSAADIARLVNGIDHD